MVSQMLIDRFYKGTDAETNECDFEEFLLHPSSGSLSQILISYYLDFNRFEIDSDQLSTKF